jgi:hypothetical protein
MVTVGYMIDNPGPPSGLKSFLNRRVIPPAIDAAGAVESAVYALAEQTRAQPKMSLGVAAALGLLAGTLVFRRLLPPSSSTLQD